MTAEEIIETATTEEDYIPIKINITTTHDGSGIIVGKIGHHKWINGCVAQGKTKEEVKRKLNAMLTVHFNYSKETHKKYRQRAIFRGNWSKNQIWFSIVGIGLIFYIRPKEYKNNEYFKKNLIFGKFRITFTNEWKIKK